MDEFKQLPWSTQDACDDMEQIYRLDMADTASRNVNDVFFKLLLEIDPTHYRFIDRGRNGGEKSNDIHNFTDPRTGIASKNLLCLVKDPDLCRRNIFMAERVATSKLKRYEHEKCLNAIRLINCGMTNVELTADASICLELYEATKSDRIKENQLFLEKLRAHFDAHLFQRFHTVPPTIEQFVLKMWKRKLIEMHRSAGTARLQLKTALRMQCADFDVCAALMYSDQLGEVDEMCDRPIRHVRQSSAILDRIYTEQRASAFLTAVQARANEIRQRYKINFQLPMSVISLMLCDGGDWSFPMSVDESSQSVKTVIFGKPMPPFYLSGVKRYRKGAKYVIRSCFTRRASDSNDCDGGVIDAGLSGNSTVAYKLMEFDEFIRSHQPDIQAKKTKANRFFRIFDFSGNADDDEIETFRVLIPAKQDTCRRDASGDITLVNLSAKIEFQAEYGAEVMTKGELIREWCNLYFRPGSVTERVHFDCVSGKVIHQQTITLEQVTASLRSQYNIESQQLLRRLFSALATFNQFPDGEYVLRREKNAANLVKAYEKSTDPAASQTIAQLYESMTFDTNLMDPVHWRTLDNTIVTELHKQHQIIPGCFPHNDYFISNRIHPAKLKKNRKQQKWSTICPADDRQKSAKLTPRQERDKKYVSGARRQKKQRRAERVKQQRITNATESSGMTMHRALVDDYSEPFGGK